MKNIIFIAPPAAGKGTQSNLLKDKYDYVHISTGDMLREIVSSDSELGKVVKNIIDKGNLVSDDLIFKLLKSKLNSIKGKPFILDGFPRTLNQALFLDNDLKIDNYIVIYLDLSKEDAIKRIDGRLTCSCGKSYNLNDINLKPKIIGICDNCGNVLVKRNDDNLEAFKIRFDVFLKNIKPLIDYYKDKNKLKVVNVNRDVNDIFREILKVVADD